MNSRIPSSIDAVTRRDWLLYSGGGFRASSLGGLARPETAEPSRESSSLVADLHASWRTPGDGEERHLPLHGRGAEPSRHL